MDVTVLIATYNRAALLGEAIEAVLAQRLPPGLTWELLVVDNNSHDATPEVVQRYARGSTVPVRYLREPHQGKSNALNAGLGEAQGNVVAFTDDDVLVPPDWVATALRVLDRWGAEGAGGRILPRWEMSPPQWLANSPLLRARLALVEVETSQVLKYPIRGPGIIWGANMIFRRTVFDHIGAFDVKLGPIGSRPVNSEDLDMVERAVLHGHTLVYDPEIVVYHRIPSARMRMSYFRRREFAGGLARALRAAPVMGRFAVLGRPAWVYLRTGAALGRWLIAASLRRPDALELELEFFGTAGLLRWYPESLRLTQRDRAG
jgi:glycosyltransferase involved in cell wall biosynthesis